MKRNQPFETLTTSLTKNYKQYRASWKKLPDIDDSDNETDNETNNENSNPENSEKKNPVTPENPETQVNSENPENTETQVNSENPDDPNDPNDPENTECPYKKSDLEMKFYKDEKYIFSVTRCFFESDPRKNELLVEWIEFKEKTYLILSHEHGCLTVFDADSGKQISQSLNNDMFLSDYKFYDDKEYLYLSGWFWSPVPMRTVFHIPTFLQAPGYKPIPVTCANANDKTNPGFDLYGSETCKEFLEKHDEIVKEIRHKNQRDQFNYNRQTDTLLRRFYEVNGLVEFEGDSKALLGQILSSDREIFYANSIGNISGDELGHSWALTIKLESKYDNFNYVLSDALFRSIDMMPLEVINFRFEIYSELGNLVINIVHKLIDCNKLKETYGDNLPEYYTNRIKRIDPDTKMNIRCKIL